MNILLDNEQLCVKFKFLCKQYDHFEWAVAWAGNDFEESKLLGKYSDKIDKLIVGLHFYQTHPNFIRQYMEHPRVRFNPQTNDLFHSKIYLFYNTDQDWAAIIGSSNFTDSAFHKKG
jgi:phosphatidylserine/phosphatidylglycerophosphate/cardiolipin synthase-like enzyme